ncbi:hypothetical protein RRG08_044005 [Elysia crispata]|uniref:Uncharacterized protein n=1 Tax=Elysia crispata TaxID=231223 RepID=A0AAE1CQU1_9GAST|nr:hypothetical protein RRG08_044005 [Elysia crispata]
MDCSRCWPSWHGHLPARPKARKSDRAMWTRRGSIINPSDLAKSVDISGRWPPNVRPHAKFNGHMRHGCEDWRSAQSPEFIPYSRYINTTPDR